MRPLIYAALTVALVTAVVGFSATTAFAQDQIAADRVTITITDKGITDNLSQPLGGLYVVTVRNDSSAPRGLVMKGIDRAVSPYIRFSPVLEPGSQVTFRWYFPSDRKVMVRDLLCCNHAQRSCIVAGFGELTTSLVFT